MGKKATKAADNVYCIARYKAAETNTVYESREKTAEALGIDRTRLARIELGTICPYPEEVLNMSLAYEAPELCNTYCARECSIGRQTVPELTVDDLDRLTLKVLGSLKDVEELRRRLITIAADGQITNEERPEFDSILDELEDLAVNAQALQLWARKNIQEK
ncbi:MAG: XRE family transcriptional regulator [Oscillospiraceae bacterium]|nr:XRE family transcriptional regulator [Oscillospiraceae bacterium]